MKEKLTSQENVSNKTLDKIKEDFEYGMRKAIEKGELTKEEFIELRKDMAEIMGDIAVEVERKTS